MKLSKRFMLSEHRYPLTFRDLYGNMLMPRELSN